MENRGSFLVMTSGDFYTGASTLAQAKDARRMSRTGGIIEETHQRWSGGTGP